MFILHLLELVDGQQINMDTILDIKVHLRWDLYLDFRTAAPLASYCQLSFIVWYNLFYVPLHWKKESAVTVSLHHWQWFQILAIF